MKTYVDDLYIVTPFQISKVKGHEGIADYVLTSLRALYSYAAIYRAKTSRRFRKRYHDDAILI